MAVGQWVPTFVCFAFRIGIKTATLRIIFDHNIWAHSNPQFGERIQKPLIPGFQHDKAAPDFGEIEERDRHLNITLWTWLCVSCAFEFRIKSYPWNWQSSAYEKVRCDIQDKTRFVIRQSAIISWNSTQILYITLLFDGCWSLWAFTLYILKLPGCSWKQTPSFEYSSLNFAKLNHSFTPGSFATPPITSNPDLFIISKSFNRDHKNVMSETEWIRVSITWANTVLSWISKSSSSQ